MKFIHIESVEIPRTRIARQDIERYIEPSRIERYPSWSYYDSKNKYSCGSGTERCTRYSEIYRAEQGKKLSPFRLLWYQVQTAMAQVCKAYRVEQNNSRARNVLLGLGNNRQRISVAKKVKLPLAADRCQCPGLAESQSWGAYDWLRTDYRKWRKTKHFLCHVVCT